jgi:hypothetical protein
MIVRPYHLHRGPDYRVSQLLSYLELFVTIMKPSSSHRVVCGKILLQSATQVLVTPEIPDCDAYFPFRSPH